MKRLRLVSGPKPPKGVKPVAVKCEGFAKRCWWWEEDDNDKARVHVQDDR